MARRRPHPQCGGSLGYANMPAICHDRHRSGNVNRCAAPSETPTAGNALDHCRRRRRDLFLDLAAAALRAGRRVTDIPRASCRARHCSVGRLLSHASPLLGAWIRRRGMHLEDANMSQYDYDLVRHRRRLGRRAREPAGGAEGRAGRDRRGIRLRRHLRDPRLHPEEAVRLCQPFRRGFRGLRPASVDGSDGAFDWNVLSPTRTRKSRGSKGCIAKNVSLRRRRDLHGARRIRGCAYGPADEERKPHGHGRAIS